MKYSSIDYEHREVVLKNKPQSMLDLSPKGTVPIMQVGGELIEESLDIMHWALRQSDPENWLQPGNSHSLVDRCDQYFKDYLDRYKYSDRYPEYDRQADFMLAVEYLVDLEKSLESSGVIESFLTGKQISWVDVAIFPFVRQFAFVDKMAFDNLSLPRLHSWLNYFLTSHLFISVMEKFPAWVPEDIATHSPS